MSDSMPREIVYTFRTSGMPVSLAVYEFRFMRKASRHLVGQRS